MIEAKPLVDLPEGWTAECDPRGVIITRFINGKCEGSVTVSEQTRGFLLGIQTVRERSEKYQGRGWKVALYKDAIDALNKCR